MLRVVGKCLIPTLTGFEYRFLAFCDILDFEVGDFELFSTVNFFSVLTVHISRFLVFIAFSTIFEHYPHCKIF